MTAISAGVLCVCISMPGMPEGGHGDYPVGRLCVLIHTHTSITYM